MLNADAARTIAAAIRPQIKQYIENNREKYEAWLQAERESEPANSLSYIHERESSKGGD